MTTPRQLGSYWDRRSEDFDAIYTGQRSRIRCLWDRLTRRNMRFRSQFTVEALSPVRDKTILDVGCGSGRLAVELAARGAARVVGVDLSKQMLLLAKRLADQRDCREKCTFVQADILDYHPTPDSFDAVIAMGFFDYVRDPGPVMNRLRTLLRGMLVASFPAAWSLRTPFRKAWLALRGCPVYFFSGPEIRRMCADTGFTCKKLVRFGPIYLLVATPSC